MKHIRFSALMLALLCMLLTPMSALAATFSAAVQESSMSVYSDASLTKVIGTLKKDTVVRVHDYSGNVAKISLGKNKGYAPVSSMVAVSEIATEAKINRNTKVYAKASTSSKSISVKKGMRVNVLATSGSWARVENAGIVAYIKLSHLTMSGSENPEPPTAQAVIFNTDSRVYKKASVNSASMSIKKGFICNLLAVKGDWAQVENMGLIAYTNINHLTKGTTLPDEIIPDVTPEPEPDYSHLMKDAKPATFNTSAPVYKKADTSSESSSAAKDLKVNLLAVNGDWALIELNGKYGFTQKANLSLVPDKTVTPDTPSTPDSSYFDSSKYSNEQKCYLFLTREMGLNSAAACGILANIRRESNFNPKDTYSIYYGICQWGSGRLANMKSYCASNGFSNDSLEGQLRFLAYELGKSYPTILAYLKGVSNTAQGAYDAGYYFCYNYERPGARESSSVSRGELARDTYFPKYQ